MLRDTESWTWGRDIPHLEVGALYRDLLKAIHRILEERTYSSAVFLDVDALEKELYYNRYKSEWIAAGFIEEDDPGNWWP